jgi:hypothetical protein
LKDSYRTLEERLPEIEGVVAQDVLKWVQRWGMRMTTVMEGLLEEIVQESRGRRQQGSLIRSVRTAQKGISAELGLVKEFALTHQHPILRREP